MSAQDESDDSTNPRDAANPAGDGTSNSPGGEPKAAPKLDERLSPELLQALADTRIELACNFNTEETFRLLASMGANLSVLATGESTAKFTDHQVTSAMQKLATGEIDQAIFFCPETVQHFRSVAEQRLKPARLDGILADIDTFASNQATSATLEQFGAVASIMRDEQHRPVHFEWRKTLTFFDQHYQVANRNMMLFGDDRWKEHQTSLVAGLEARGANVSCVNVSTWNSRLGNKATQQQISLTIDRIASRQTDVLFVDDFEQVDALSTAAFNSSQESAFRQSLDEHVILIQNIRSPEMDSTSERIPVDFEFVGYDPVLVASKLGQFIPDLIRIKRNLHGNG